MILAWSLDAFGPPRRCSGPFYEKKKTNEKAFFWPGGPARLAGPGNKNRKQILELPARLAGLGIPLRVYGISVIRPGTAWYGLVRPGSDII